MDINKISSGTINSICTQITLSLFNYTAIGLLTMLQNIYSYNNTTTEDALNRLKDLDIHFKLDIVNNFMINVIKNNENNIKMMEIINNIQLIIENIHKELNIVHQYIQYHRSLYFNKYRNFDCQKHINKIITNNKILDNRIDLLSKLYGHHFNNMVSYKPTNELSSYIDEHYSPTSIIYLKHNQICISKK